MYVHNEPIAVEGGGRAGGGMLSSRKTISSSAVQKPISIGTGGKAGKNEIFGASAGVGVGRCQRGMRVVGRCQAGCALILASPPLPHPSSGHLGAPHGAV